MKKVKLTKEKYDEIFDRLKDLEGTVEYFKFKEDHKNGYSWSREYVYGYDDYGCFKSRHIYPSSIKIKINYIERGNQRVVHIEDTVPCFDKIYGEDVSVFKDSGTFYVLLQKINKYTEHKEKKWYKLNNQLKLIEVDVMSQKKLNLIKEDD